MSILRTRPLALAAALGVAAVLAPAALGQEYRTVYLGTLGGTASAAAALNDKGQVVGASVLEDGAVHAFFWSEGVMEDLGTLPGGDSSAAYGVNNHGQVVGTSTDAEGRYRAVLWERTESGWTITDIGAIDGGANAYARRINDSGQIVGQCNAGAGGMRGFLYTDGQFVNMGVLHYPNHGTSDATGLNDAGWVVGYAYAFLWGPEHGYVYDGERTTDITNEGQFALGHPMAINNAGVIAGWYDGFEAAIYQNGAWTGLGTLPGHSESYAYDLNEAGQVVGYSAELSTQDFRGFLYTGGRMHDLNEITTDAELLIADAPGINEAGQIVANAVTRSGVEAMLLVPVAACPGDFDGDGQTTVADFTAFRTAYLAGDMRADYNGNGALDVGDFTAFRVAYLAGCP